MTTLTRATPQAHRRAADRPLTWGWIGGLGVLLVLSVLSLFIGAAEVSITDVLLGRADERATMTFFVSRVPRTVAILLAGAALGLSGMLMQLLVRNRFVEPGTVGTSESASVGILIAILLFPGAPLLLKMTFAVATALIGTAVFIRLIRSLPPRAPIVAVPLVGIMLAGVISAATTFVAYRFDLLQALDIWMQGDFSGILKGRYELLWLLAGVAVAMWWYADRFTVASLGEAQATSLGLSYRATLNLGLGIVAVASAICLVVVGGIGFVGLIIPNLVTMWRGDNLRRNIGWTALFGAGFVLACDLIGRTINAPYEVPVGVVSGVVGGTVFLVLLLTGRVRAR